MINFILVEDNIKYRKNTEDLIVKYMMKNDYEFKITSFAGETKELLKLINKEEDNNIFILDFELPDGVTAIDIARDIREIDWRSPIIILTAHGGMAFESFKQRLQILDFVSKQFEADKNLLELFDICLKQLGLSKSLKFKYNSIDYSIPYEKIYYIYRETSERKAIIVTKNKNYKVRLNLKELKSDLPSYFKYSHKACIINSEKVENYDWKNYTILFSDEISTNLLSKTHKKELSKI